MVKNKFKILKILLSMMCIITLITPHTLALAELLPLGTINGGREAIISISREHEGGTAYKIQPSGETNAMHAVNIFKLIELIGIGGSNFNNEIFCAWGGGSFPANTVGDPEPRNYVKVGNLRTTEGKIGYINYGTNIVDHTLYKFSMDEEHINNIISLAEIMYLRHEDSKLNENDEESETIRTNSRREFLNKAFAKKFKEEEENNVTPRTTIEMIENALSDNTMDGAIIDDTIEVIEQWAMWYFTDHYDGSKYHKDTIAGSFGIMLEKGKNETNYSQLTDTNPTKQTYAGIIYNYLVDTASSKVPDEEKEAPELVLPASTTSVLENEYYKIGPIRLNTGDYSPEDFESIELVDQNNSPIDSSRYKIKLEGQEAFTDKSIDQIFNQNYYIYIPIANNTITSVEIKVQYSQHYTDVDLWQPKVPQSGNITYQPIVVIKRKTNPIQEKLKFNIDEKQFDLSLRKFIVKYGENTTGNERNPNSEGNINLTNLKTGNDNTAEYYHAKNPLGVYDGDKVIYQINVYNEGDIDGKVTQIKDYLPEGLSYVPRDESTINAQYNWVISADGKTATTDYTKDTNLVAFDKTSNSLSTTYVQIECRVNEGVEAGTILTNVAEITADLPAYINDRDSEPGTINPAEINSQTYIGNASNKSDLSDSRYFYKGQEDDDDFEKVIVLKRTEYDLALKKFIIKRNEEEITNREPQVSGLQELWENDEVHDAIYTKEKTPVMVEIGDIVTYKIRIYNEGTEDAKVGLVYDYLPEGLEFVEDSAINSAYGWRKSTGNNRRYETEYLKDTVIPKFDGTTLSSEDLIMECRVVAEQKAENQELKNVAEIAQDDGDDIDSTPGNVNPEGYPDHNIEDDDDFEIIEIPGKKIDLALRKFIVKYGENTTGDERNPNGPNNIDITKLTTGADTTADYYHSKDALPVENEDKIIYQINIYNEGELNAVATEIKDYLPEGLKYVEDSEINRTYGWRISEDKKTATTTYTSNQTLNAFDKENGILSTTYVQIECIVDKDVEAGKILTNVAEISADLPESIPDRDSVPGNINPAEINSQTYIGNASNKSDLSDSRYFYKGQEDDDDFEKVIVIKNTKFDLALKKFIIKRNDEDITNRIPIVSDLEELASNDEVHDAIYEQIKTPVLVEIGDIVIYKIRVYNEGTEDGIASLVYDYLPEGLEFVENSELNREYRWVKSEGNNRRYETDYLKDTVIPKFDGQDLHYADLQMECKVVADQLQENQRLRNIAAIAEDNGDDCDSTPGEINPETYPDRPLEDDDDFEIIEIPGRKADLALKKFIVKRNNEEITNRVPIVSGLDELANNEDVHDAIYEQVKTPLLVEIGDIVIYKIRVYNEGTMDAKATVIYDYLPEGLEFVENSEINTTYKWKKSEGNNRKYETDYLKDTVIPKFDGQTLHYVDLQMECKVVADQKAENQKIKNIATIAEDDIDDIDSTPGEINPETYPDTPLEDDDDFEIIEIPGREFDLSLTKHINSVNGKAVDPSREPRYDVSGLRNGTSKDAEFTQIKTPVVAEIGDIIIYTIRVYNEGDIAGYADEVADILPEGLGFLANYKVNIDNCWSAPSNATSIKLTDITNGKKNLTLQDFEGVTSLDDVKVIPGKVKLISNKLKYNPNDNSNLIKPFDKTNENSTLDYKDIQVACILMGNGSENVTFKNIAEVEKDLDKDGNEVTDRDSTPGNVETKHEDDDDYEIVTLVPKEFDLALRKFITKVDDTDVTTRIPQVVINENGEIRYVHPKDPVEVANNQIVTYTIRVFNEGEIDGYASEITDNIPEGLEFLPDNEVNIKYTWKMYDANGREVSNVSEAESIKTDYLSKEKSEARNENCLIKAYDESRGISNDPNNPNPDYRDVKVVFKVADKNVNPDKIITNIAKVTKMQDKDGNPATDRDEDDLTDIEKVKLKEFDLALKKYVKKVIVIEDNEVSETITNYNGNEDPEPLVKVEVNRKKLDSTIVKFVYTIKVTNEGDIPGYATEITDYIPDGLEFVQEDNKIWTEKADGIITTNALIKTLLNPGESAEVEVTLRWKNGEDNLGRKVNWAEISEDYNEYHVHDKDSTPDNRIETEDDMDWAQVLLTVSTGSEPVYITLALGILIVIAIGIIVIKKFLM